MSAAEHTPGPWHVDSTKNDGEYGNRGPDTRSGFDSYVVFDEQGRALFDSVNSAAIEVQEESGEDDCHAWDAVGKANLTLAAAAPELLTALREAADQLQGWVNWKCPKKHVAEHQRYIDGIRALIAKAEGGAHA